jgi:coenzyme F420 biosynthesis associated uncharacterized protein
MTAARMAPMPRRRDDRTWRLGVAVGLGAGIAFGLIGRRADRLARRGLVDWAEVEAIAGRRLRGAPGALTAAELTATQPAWAEVMTRILPHLEAHLGRPLPGVVERHAVVDRTGWAAANMVTFQEVLRRVEPALVKPIATGRTPGEAVAALANRVIATRQIGYLLGYLGTRVLGQYDVAILSAESVPGRLLFVEENVRQAARQLGVPLDEMRTWIALHESTHAFEFEAHPWLRPYLAARLERLLAAFLDDAQALQLRGLPEMLRRIRRPDGDFVSSLLGPEQRRLLRETQVVMSLLEGFSDWVMDSVGGELMRDVATVRTRFEARRAMPRRGLDALIAHLSGLDLKLDQYRRGERFVSGVVAAAGSEAVEWLWSGPDALPTERELTDPAAWLRRVRPAAVA